jgi:hypothetical protein
LRQTIPNGFINSVSFVSAVDPQLYYITDYGAKSILVFNENWVYQRTITTSSNGYPSYSPQYSININGSIYVTGVDVINKYDSYLSLKKQVSSLGYYTGIYYNSANQMIYIANYHSNSINVYDKDLNFIRTISINHSQWFITEYNGQMVVTTFSDGNIYFYQSESLNRRVATKCTRGITSVLFDNNNQMIVSCRESDIYIYNVDGTYTGLKVNACSSSNSKYFVNFDSKDRLVFICSNRVEIFY